MHHIVLKCFMECLDGNEKDIMFVKRTCNEDERHKIQTQEI